MYILRCGDDTLYTGITNDITARLEKHKAGTGAKYTRGRSPLTLFYSETLDTRGAALKREAAIKNLPRAGKLALAGA